MTLEVFMLVSKIFLGMCKMFKKFQGEGVRTVWAPSDTALSLYNIHIQITCITTDKFCHNTRNVRI